MNVLRTKLHEVKVKLRISSVKISGQKKGERKRVINDITRKISL